MAVKNSFSIIFTTISFFIFMGTTNAEQYIKNYSAKDVFSFTRIAQVLPSPDGKAVAYVTMGVNAAMDNKKWMYSLFLKDASNNIKLLVRSENISSINFSPNGKEISYLALGRKYQSIWMINLSHGQKTKLLEFTQDIDSYKWSPNGEFVAFLSHNEKSILNVLKPVDVSKDYINTRLYIFPVQERKTAKAFTDVNISITDFDWSPDSKSIAYAFQPKIGFTYANDNKLRILKLANSSIKEIPFTNTHVGIHPYYSPDGKWIAFSSNLLPSTTAQSLNGDININNRICVVNTTSFASHCLANTFNQNSGILGWNSASTHVFVLDAYKSTGYLIYSLDLDSAKPAKLISNIDGFIEPLTISLNQNHSMFGFGYETASNAPEAYISTVEPFKLNKVTRLNSLRFKSILGRSEIINWKSTDGMDIEGLFLTPKNYDANKKYPLYVAVHGGPAGAWNKRFLGGCDEYGEMIDTTTCWQNLLSLGFVILQPNPRGSDGYGLSFRLANYKDFGGGDYQDVMTGVDNLIDKGIVDSRHLAIGGWSYGGYLTAWAISQSDRFKAAVEGDGNTDFISFSGTSNAPAFFEKYLGSAFWVNNKLYLERAPIMHVQNIHTPLFIMHGENDQRVPLSQSYELYTALEKQHKPVKMIIFPKQHHVPTDANIIYESINEVDEWLKKAIN